MSDAPLWTSGEIVAATGGAVHRGPFTVTGVTFDSREVAPGDLFVALAGERDGHDFIPKAFASGAAGVLAARPVEGGPAVVVADTLRALEQLGVAARERAPARRAAVTGSVGKTSVTQAIRAALDLAGRGHGSVKSFNNHIGVPLTLARMPRNTQRAVFEIGMNHAGEIGPLSPFRGAARGGGHHRRPGPHRELRRRRGGGRPAPRRKSSKGWRPAARPF